MNNVEPDHLECYGSVAALEDAFVEFAGRARVALVSADDPGAQRVAARVARCRAVRLRRRCRRSDRRRGAAAPTAPRPRIRWRGGREARLRLAGARTPQPAKRRGRAGRGRCAGWCAWSPPPRRWPEFSRRGPPVRAAGRARRRGGGGRLRAPPVGARGHAGGRAAGVSGAAARRGLPAAPLLAHRGARRGDGRRRSPRPIWCS